MQEAMLSHSYNKTEALPAQHLFEYLSAQAEAAEQHLPIAAHKHVLQTQLPDFGYCHAGSNAQSWLQQGRSSGR